MNKMDEKVAFEQPPQIRCPEEKKTLQQNDNPNDFPLGKKGLSCFRE